MNTIKLTGVYKRDRVHIVSSLSAKYGANVEDIEDALQTAVVYILERWEKYRRWDAHRLAQALYTVAECRAINIHRGNQRRGRE